jgi:hypothetical protein
MFDGRRHNEGSPLLNVKPTNLSGVFAGYSGEMGHSKNNNALKARSGQKQHGGRVNRFPQETADLGPVCWFSVSRRAASPLPAVAKPLNRG